MSNFKIVCVLLVSMFMTGCMSIDVSPEPLWEVGQKPYSEVLVYRDKNWLNGRPESGFGSEEHNVVAIKNGQYSIVPIPAGSYIFHITGAGGTPPYVLSTVLAPEKRTCIKVSGNTKAAMTSAFIPIAGFMMPAYLGDIVDCPDELELSEYIRKEPMLFKEE